MPDQDCVALSTKEFYTKYSKKGDGGHEEKAIGSSRIGFAQIVASLRVLLLRG
jgi:hypothetical protein